MSQRDMIMVKEDSLRWQKILWSVVIIFALTLLAYIKYVRSNGIISFGIFPYFIWPYVIVPSIVTMLLRLPRMGLTRKSFIYIFIGTVNVYIGAVGLYLVVRSDTSMSFSIHAMFCINIL